MTLRLLAAALGGGLALTAVALMGCGDDGATTGDGGDTAQGGAGVGGSGVGGDVGGSGGAGMGGAGGAVVVGDWSCVGVNKAPQFYDGPDESLTVTVRDYLTSDPLVGVQVRACDANDGDCASPGSEAMTNSSGVGLLDVSPGTMHYIEASRSDMPTQLFFLPGPVSELPSAEISWTPLLQTTVNGFLALVMVTLDPTRGMLALRLYDCAGDPAEGVTFEVDTADADTVVGYFNDNGFPDLSRTTTSSTGEAGIANLPVGPATVTATLPDGSFADERKVVVRAGSITSALQEPRYPQAVW